MRKRKPTAVVGVDEDGFWATRGIVETHIASMASLFRVTGILSSG